MSRAAAGPMRIEVVYSPAPREVECVALELPEGATVAAALEASGLLRRHAELGTPDAPAGGVGVWGQACGPGQALRDGDRVELYRALQVDPKEARRLRQRQAPEGGAAAPRRGGEGGRRARPLSGS